MYAASVFTMLLQKEHISCSSVSFFECNFGGVTTFFIYTNDTAGNVVKVITGTDYYWCYNEVIRERFGDGLKYSETETTTKRSGRIKSKFKY